MSNPAKTKAPTRKPKKKQPSTEELAFVVSERGGIFEHVADDLEDDEADSVYLRDVHND